MDGVVPYRLEMQAKVADGFRFYLSVNKVWLTKEVPVKYLEKVRG
jgi:putative RNA 2'-phosphotransferase